jgi:hypothetical protein
MANKSQPKKASSSKSSTKAKSAKNKSNKSTKSDVSLRNSRSIATDYKDLFYGTISASMVYVFALWAIDSGSLWVYGFTFAAVYYTAHFFRLFIKSKLQNNDKARKAK